MTQTMIPEAKIITRKPRYPVLIVEDNRETGELLAQLCDDLEIEYDLAENGKIALEKVEEKNYSLFIVDLMMPVMDGRTMIPLLKKKVPGAVIVVQSALDSADTIIQVMKMEVFDYLMKPVDPDNFQQVLAKALEFRYLKEFEESQSLQAGKKIQSQMDWLLYKQERLVRDQKNADFNSIYKLKEYMSQGAGIGTMTTVIDLMARSSEKDEDHYKVKSEIFDFVIENNRFFRTQIEGLRTITDILDSHLEVEETTSTKLLEMIPAMASKVIPFMKKKHQSLTYPELKREYPVQANLNLYSMILEELLINAYKYTPEKGNIDIMARAGEGYLWISVKNDVDERGIIDEEQARMIIEPFYRLLPPDESISSLERFAFGLGLTVVDNVMRKHGGLFTIGTVIDHTRKEEQSCILSSLLFPL
jgi:DNA-binding response OmpR family regulator